MIEPVIDFQPHLAQCERVRKLCELVRPDAFSASVPTYRAMIFPRRSEKLMSAIIDFTIPAEAKGRHQSMMTRQSSCKEFGKVSFAIGFVVKAGAHH